VRKSFRTAPPGADMQTMTNCTVKVLPLLIRLIPRPGAGLISLKTQNVVREDTNHGGKKIQNVVREDTNHGGKK
jgi:hypothetical protein